MTLNNDFKKYIDIVKSDAEKTQQEKMNRLASSLRTEYTDFTSILDTEMSLELGENLRSQLTEIFSILKKNGIKLDK